MCNIYAEITCFMARPKSFPKGRMCACAPAQMSTIRLFPSAPLLHLLSLFSSAFTLYTLHCTPRQRINFCRHCLSWPYHLRKKKMSAQNFWEVLSDGQEGGELGGEKKGAIDRRTVEAENEWVSNYPAELCLAVRGLVAVCRRVPWCIDLCVPSNYKTHVCLGRRHTFSAFW